MPYDEFDWFYWEKLNLEEAIISLLEDEPTPKRVLSSLIQFLINCEYNIDGANANRSYEDEAIRLYKQLSTLVFPKMMDMASERGVIQDLSQ